MTGQPAPDTSRLERRLGRERAARVEAETIAERVTSELFETVQELACSRLVLDETTDLVTIIEPSGRASYVNRSFCEFFWLEHDDPPDDLEFLECLTPTARARWADEVVGTLEDKSVWRGELELVSPTGDELPVSLVAIAHARADGQVDSISCIARDISEQRALHQHLAHQALHDALTGLPNRRRFYESVEHAVATSDPERTVAVLFIDLDDFKQINDTLGHDAGDGVLVTVAERLRSAVRSADSVCRFGGDEFGVLCAGIRGDHEAAEVAARTLAALDAPIDLGGREVSVSVSVGVAVAEPGTGDGPALVRTADQAMYQAKRMGKHRSVVAPTGLGRVGFAAG